LPKARQQNLFQINKPTLNFRIGFQNKFSILLFIFTISCLPVPSDPPYGFGVQHADKEIKKNSEFYFLIELKSFEKDMENVKIEFVLPPDVKLLNGKLVWNGKIPAKSEQKFNIKMVSRVDWEEWNTEIKGRVEFIYAGEKKWREIKWSANGFEDSDWNGVHYTIQKWKNGKLERTNRR
jgi:hypothetical protein